MKKKEKQKLDLKEKLKDKRERAKIELILYGIFIVVVIIFTKTGRAVSPQNTDDTNVTNTDNFIKTITDNYEYDIKITINENSYEYYGKALGNNGTITLKEEDNEKTYYLMNKKYYLLNNENYILTDEKTVYPYIDYHYLNINNIKKYISISTKENNTYKTKISDILLNNNSEEYITINIEEGDKNIEIDYTPLLKITDDNIEKAIVNITYHNINNIISLEE